MVSTPLLLILAVALVGPAPPPLSVSMDFQQGYFDGARAGLEMGNLLGAARYDPSVYAELGQACQRFNTRLVEVFGNASDPRARILWAWKP